MFNVLNPISFSRCGGNTQHPNNSLCAVYCLIGFSQMIISNVFKVQFCLNLSVFS